MKAQHLLAFSHTDVNISPHKDCIEVNVAFNGRLLDEYTYS